MDRRMNPTKELKDAKEGEASPKKVTADLMKNLDSYNAETHIPKAPEYRTLSDEENLQWRGLQKANVLMERYDAHLASRKEANVNVRAYFDVRAYVEKSSAFKKELDKLAKPDDMRTYLLRYRAQFGADEIEKNFLRLHQELQRIDKEDALHEQRNLDQWLVDVKETLAVKTQKRADYKQMLEKKDVKTNPQLSRAARRAIKALDQEEQILTNIVKKHERTGDNQVADKKPRVEMMELEAYVRIKTKDALGLDKLVRAQERTPAFNTEMVAKSRENLLNSVTGMVKAWDLSKHITATRGNKLSDRFEHPLEKRVQSISEQIDPIDNYYYSVEKMVAADIVQRDGIENVGSYKIHSYLKNKKGVLERQREKETDATNIIKLGEEIKRVEAQSARMGEVTEYKERANLQQEYLGTVDSSMKVLNKLQAQINQELAGIRSLAREYETSKRLELHTQMLTTLQKIKELPPTLLQLQDHMGNEDERSGLMAQDKRSSPMDEHIQRIWQAEHGMTKPYWGKVRAAVNVLTSNRGVEREKGKQSWPSSGESLSEVNDRKVARNALESFRENLSVIGRHVGFWKNEFALEDAYNSAFSDFFESKNVKDLANGYQSQSQMSEMRSSIEARKQHMVKIKDEFQQEFEAGYEEFVTRYEDFVDRYQNYV